MLGITKLVRSFQLGSVLAAVAALGLAGPSAAQVDQGEKFEEFLGDVCATGSVSGGLAVQCADVAGAVDPAKPLSTDSQNALTPTQNLSSNENLLFRAQALNRQINKRNDQRRRRENEGMETADVAALSALPFETGGISLFLNARGTWFDKSAEPNERGFDGTTASVLFGGDYRISDRFVAGGLFARTLRHPYANRHPTPAKSAG